MRPVGARWGRGPPLVRNGLVEVIILDFMTAWATISSALTNDQDVRTMPVVLAAAQGSMGQWAWPRIAAVYVLVVTPGILAFAQRLFFKGLMEGVLKASLLAGPVGSGSLADNSTLVTMRDRLPTPLRKQSRPGFSLAQRTPFFKEPDGGRVEGFV